MFSIKWHRKRCVFSYLLRGAGELRAGAGARVLVELEARAPVQAAAEAVVPARACGKRRICFLRFSSLFVPSLSWQEMSGFHEKERGKGDAKRRQFIAPLQAFGVLPRLSTMSISPFIGQPLPVFLP